MLQSMGSQRVGCDVPTEQQYIVFAQKKSFSGD